MDTRTAIIVDDEPHARSKLARILDKLGIEIICSFPDAASCRDFLYQNPPPTFLFLDICMESELSGLELASEVVTEIAHPPHVIFVTAYRHHAVKAFELNALDFLEKPFEEERVAKAIQRQIGRQAPQFSPDELRHMLAQAEAKRFEVKVGRLSQYLYLSDVSLFESRFGTIYAKSNGREFRTLWEKLDDVVAAFPNETLKLIDRHQLVRPEKITHHKAGRWGGMLIYMGGTEYKVTRGCAKELKPILG